MSENEFLEMKTKIIKELSGGSVDKMKSILRILDTYLVKNFYHKRWKEFYN